MRIHKIVSFLSHRPKTYALLVGIGIVLFWRGVWHTVDQIHSFFSYSLINGTVDTSISPWWDGPVSFLAGSLILYFSGAFISSFIGNELILSGLRGEKKLNQQTEAEVSNEMQSILVIKESLKEINRTLEHLEEKVLKNHYDK